MTQQVSLSLPDLAPGEEPPSNCPHCGSAAQHEPATRSHLAAHRYACHGCYFDHSLNGVVKWLTTKQTPCARPTAPAVLRAVLALLTPEQRARVAMDEDHAPEHWTWDGDPLYVEQCISAAADALET